MGEVDDQTRLIESLEETILKQEIEIRALRTGVPSTVWINPKAGCVCGYPVAYEDDTAYVTPYKLRLSKSLPWKRTRAEARLMDEVQLPNDLTGVHR